MELFDWVHTQLQGWPFAGQVLLWLILAVVALVVLSLLFSLLFAPFMWLYNRLTDGNQNNVMPEADYVTGELTAKIHGKSTGEVMETSSSGGSVHPARLFDEDEIAKDTLYPVGTKVLIIAFDESGIALVVRNKQFI
ncbi:hypothetical protein [Enterococcus sp. 2201sp1_2201st1_B8_2201SCRN_220225]|uniref:hypothetical protein n=1 Tax=unclassified Enterococcus TaxID=2608891 RepID=UPI0034A297FE